MESLEAGFFDSREGGRIGRVPLGPANVGVRRMHTRRKEADDRECLRFSNRVFGPQVKSLAEVGKNSGVLGQRLAIIETQRGHAS